MGSAMPFLFNTVDLHVVNANTKPCICAWEVCKELKAHQQSINLAHNK